MNNEKEIASAFINVINNKNIKAINQADKKYLKYKNAKVTSYDENTSIATVKFVDIDHEYQYYNKSGEILQENDSVKVEYTNNLAQGIITLKYGVSKPLNNHGTLEPITAITINSDTDYMVSTNAGIEKYIAVFEDE